MVAHSPSVHCLTSPEVGTKRHLAMEGKMRVKFADDQRRGKVVAGVDTHSRTHWLCVLDEHGGVELSKEFPATQEGYLALAEAIGAPSGCLAVGVEGTASYGAGLARHLAAAGYEVYEVLRPKRGKRRRGADKSDEADAERAARDVAAGHGLSAPKSQDGWVEEVRFLLRARDCLVKSCTAAVNTARSLLQTAPEDMRAAYGGMPAERLMSSLADGGEGAMGTALSALAEAWDTARGQADAAEDEMRGLIEANCPSLLAVFGCGTICAAKLAVAAGDNPERIVSEAALAALYGAPPVRASSGEVDRHRLNRGGNRDANSALHQIVLARMRQDPETQAYIERRCGKGAGAGRKTRKEAMRCLQRYVVREIYHALRHPFEVPSGAGIDELRAARKAAGLTQSDAAGALGCSVSAISKLETGARGLKELGERYREWVDNGLPVGIEKGQGAAEKTV